MQLVSKNKRSIFLFVILLIIIVTSLSNPVILIFSDGFSLHLSSFILYLAFSLSLLKYISNSAMFHNGTLLKFIPLFFITLILSLYFTFEDFNYRKLNGLLSYFYFFIFVFIISFEKISYEKARAFFWIALIMRTMAVLLFLVLKEM